MMEPALPLFREQARRVDSIPPQLPFVSNVTGTWITPAEATTGLLGQALATGRASFDGIRELLQDPDAVLLEVGRGRRWLRLPGSIRPGAKATRSCLRCVTRRSAHRIGRFAERDRPLVLPEWSWIGARFMRMSAAAAFLAHLSV